MQLEKRGVPTAAIVTTSFTSLAQTYAKSQGLPGLPFVVVQHPVGGLQPDEASQRIVPVVGELMEALTLPPEELAPRFDGRYITQFAPPRPKLATAGQGGTRD